MVTSPRQSFGTLLKHHRRTAQLTQEQLAAQAGYTTDYVSMLERGQRVPPPATIELLARVLDLDAAARDALAGAVQPPLQANAFGRLLRRYREKAGLTQEALAERVNLSPRTISDVERGIRPWVRAEMAHLLADGLHMAPEDRTALLAALSPHRHPSRGRSVSDLPSEPNALIGREQEIMQAVTLLRARDVRLVTLTGVGGVGKTRLSLRVAATLADDFADGVTFVALGALHDVGLVPSALADALGAARLPQCSIEQSLVTHLRHRQILLVLDNVEHLLAAAPLIAHLVAACSDLKVLVTSRAPLHLTAERLLEVRPLGLPNPAERASLAVATPAPAMALFCRRAEAISPTFRVTEANAPLVAEICRRLDGLPLALELAASRTRVLTPEALLDRLDRRLSLLNAGARDLPERQQTLRRTIDWSYDLLSPEEQSLFQQLAVAAGGCTLAAVEAMAGAPALERIGTLVDQSLILVEDGDGQEARFDMLETIREYALDALRRHGGEGEARRRHARYYLALAEEAEPQLRAQRQDLWLDRLRTEHENLRSALRWLLDAEEIEAALRLAGALWRFWQVQGHFEEARRWLDAGLARGENAPVPVRAKAHFGAGFLALSQGDATRAAVHADECLMLARESGSLEHIHQALMLHGMAALQMGKSRTAMASFRESLPLAENIGRPREVARSLLNLGLAKSEAGDDQESTTLIKRALTLFRATGETSLAVVAVGSLAYNALLVGDNVRAATLLREYVELAHALSAVPDTAAGLEGMAALAVGRRGFRHAAYLLGAVDTLREQSGSRLVSPRNRAAIARAAEEARDHLGEADWQAAWLRGRSAPLAEAVAEAVRSDTALGEIEGAGDG